MSVLVTGGAGYIGSHVVSQFLERGVKVVVVDDLSTGLSSRFKSHEIHRIDLSDDSNIESLHQLMIENKVDSVIHFAAKKSAPESVKKPQF
jgi:UDP-glucose 4-epimerase